jgi:hypothetical protein
VRIGPGLRAGVLAVAVTVMVGAAATGCSVVNAAKKVAGAVQANKAIIDQFNGNLRSGQPTQFEATYTTTGSTASTITYAVQPPNDLAIAASGGSGAAAADTRFVVNSAGQFSCARATVGGWACTKQHANGTGGAQQILAIYTPAHWVTFLQDFSLAAGFAGDKVTRSTITVNGFSMQCVDFTAAGVAGTSKICTTAQHLLGYLQVASQPIGFQITKYSATPDPALFQLPAGAKITSSSASATP